MDLSKLSIRYYYTKEGIAPESFYCDNASLQMNRAPWYVAYTSTAKGDFVRMPSDKTMANAYIDIRIGSEAIFAEGATLSIDMRAHKNDWSTYNQANDYSYKNNFGIVVYYDEELVLGEEP